MNIAIEYNKSSLFIINKGICKAICLFYFSTISTYFLLFYNYTLRMKIFSWKRHVNLTINRQKEEQMNCLFINYNFLKSYYIMSRTNKFFYHQKIPRRTSGNPTESFAINYVACRDKRLRKSFVETKFRGDAAMERTFGHKIIDE